MESKKLDLVHLIFFFSNASAEYQIYVKFQDQVDS